MVAYVIAQMTVIDPDKLREYADLAAHFTAQYGGRYLARGGELTNLENTICNGRLVIAEFPNRQAAIDLFVDPDYRKIAVIREAATTTRILSVIDGIEYEGLPSAGV
ncbi:MAG: DUF1330 domain-containing protein [Rhizobiaceae bacterium]|nr:DUF1330 domain-containing protein [Rhizobiaceae bacterium]